MYISSLSPNPYASANPASAEMATALKQGMVVRSDDVYDYVNPFGDRRGNAFYSVWTFELDHDVLVLTTKEGRSSAPLQLCRDGLLSPAAFNVLQPHTPTPCPTTNTPGPRWKPEISPCPRKGAFLGRLLRDFGYAWRHVLRWPMNSVTVRRLAYATIWIATINFHLTDRIGFEHVNICGPHIKVTDLPKWEVPISPVVQIGPLSWAAFGQNVSEGMEVVQNHLNSTVIDRGQEPIVYTILTLGQVFLCRAQGQQVQWTRAETLFHDSITTSDAAINMILWAIDSTTRDPLPTRLHNLPIEIQDTILYYATVSPVASAKLGCELDLGSPFLWLDQGGEIVIQSNKRHRYESSPVESQIFFDGVMSGLSYKRGGVM
ncbi:hypothetical protein VHEMI05945 [[Torrubiella] hemipterigena]|uniref:Uncharacterized protein n=1 Tax=[Torrubiella] hemipterigena TaxID=1531966 RepID=A0A0A1TK09_9HYPO|nr:hypothetical protein VHEMI05945 [[Torrubiella] hemipterigena]